MSKTAAIKAVIFDWAGTTVDFGSIAPVEALAAAFKDADVPVSVEEIRRFMGLDKRRHVEQMLRDPGVAARWRRSRNVDPSDHDVDYVYDAFTMRLIDILPRHADPIPGLLDTIKALRSAGMKIGSNSGYSADMIAVLSRAARERGYDPDCVVSASDVRIGRPAPDLSLKCLEFLGLSTNSAAIKVDDTCTGIEEGRSAGLWTVAVAISGNEVGLSLDEWSALGAQQQTFLRERAYKRLQESTPDYIIDTVADLAGVLDGIERRIAAGERPRG